MLAALAALCCGAAAPLGAEDEIVAQAFETTLSAAELEDVLALRRAAGEEGRGSLRHLAESRLLEKLGRENGLMFSEKDLEQRAAEFDRQIKASGDAEGLAGHLKRARLSRAEFLRYLALAQVHETLTRRALGLSDTAAVTPDQQRLWMEEELGKRSFQAFAPPWKDGIAARADDFTISSAEFLAYMRKHLPAEMLREDCYQLLLAKRMLARMPDVAPERLQRAYEEEIQRRRDEAGADPRNKGVGLDQILSAQGIQVARLAEDPAVRISALSKLWVERAYDAATLKRVYQDERELFDGHYGPAHEVTLLFLRAARLKNEFNPRTFEEAEAELRGLMVGVRTRQELQQLAKQRSEDADSRAAGGELGWVSPLSPKIPREIRALVTERLALPDGQAAGLAGPLRLSTGACLLWIGRRRPAPSWDVMSAYVKAELRRRFVEDVLPRSALSTVYEEP